MMELVEYYGYDTHDLDVEGGTIFPLYDIPNLCEEWMLKEDHRDDETK